MAGEQYANNTQLLNCIIAGGADARRQWEEVKVDLGGFAGKMVTLRLYQRVLLPNRTAGNAYWKALELK